MTTDLTPIQRRSQASRKAAMTRQRLADARDYQRAPLTYTQRNVLEFVSGYIGSKNFAPTYKEIAAAMGYSGHTGVVRLIAVLVDKGYLVRRARGWQAVEMAPPNVPRLSHSHETFASCLLSVGA